MISVPEEGEEEVASVALPTHPPGKDLSLPRDLPGREIEIIPLGLLCCREDTFRTECYRGHSRAQGGLVATASVSRFVKHQMPPRVPSYSDITVTVTVLGRALWAPWLCSWCRKTQATKSGMHSQFQGNAPQDKQFHISLSQNCPFFYKKKKSFQKFLSLKKQTLRAFKDMWTKISPRKPCENQKP